MWEKIPRGESARRLRGHLQSLHDTCYYHGHPSVQTPCATLRLAASVRAARSACDAHLACNTCSLPSLAPPDTRPARKRIRRAHRVALLR
jgi:hypothetical protein